MKKIEIEYYFGIGVGYRYQTTETRYNWHIILLPFIVIHIAVKRFTETNLKEK